MTALSAFPAAVGLLLPLAAALLLAAAQPVTYSSNLPTVFSLHNDGQRHAAASFAVLDAPLFYESSPASFAVLQEQLPLRLPLEQQLPHRRIPAPLPATLTRIRTPGDGRSSGSVAADVCSIPSAPASQTRSAVLSSLAHSVASSLDPSVEPCDNMYRFACGGWLDRHNETTIPKDVSSWSKSFSVIEQRNEKILREILECSQQRAQQADNASSEPSPAAPSGEEDEEPAPMPDENAATAEGADPLFVTAATDPKCVSDNELQLGRMYAACMDMTQRNAQGAAPIVPILHRIENEVRDADSAMSVAGDLARHYLIAFFFNFGVGVSPHNPTRYIFSITQGGYPFPSRALLVGPTNVSTAYQAHIASSLQLAGLAHSAEDAEDAARRIVDFQTSLAQVAMTPEELRVPEQVNNVMTVGELEKRTGGLPFLAYLQLAMNNVSLDEETMANVGQPTQLAALGDLMRSTAPETLRDVMRWSTLLSFANDLDEPLARAHFEFFGKTISGIPQQQPMWKRCQNKAQAWMVRCLHATAAIALRVAFDETDKRARELMRLSQLAFLQRLPSLTWMTDDDKLKAAGKLAAMAVLVGANAPNKRLNFSGVPLSTDDNFENAVQLRRFNFNDTKRRFYRPVDRELFQMPAPKVNAYYDPSLNSINFPAGIIQTPFFTQFAPAAWNFGALGSVIGHELTHGFDGQFKAVFRTKDKDEGRKFDKLGALNPWWSNETSAAFANATQCLVEQYNAFALTPLNATAGAGAQEHIRGFLTLGENLADQGGLAISLDALRLEQAKEKEDTAAAQYEVDALTTFMQLQAESSGTRSQQALEEMQRAAPELSKFNEDQLFFVAYAQSWCRYVRPSAFLRALESDPHSPSEARVNVPLSNSRTFREAFGCAVTPEQEKFAHCVVW